VFNKKVLHPTTKRTEEYDDKPTPDNVKPVLEKIIAEIESERGLFERALRP
jgi:hypothetical protein